MKNHIINAGLLLKLYQYQNLPTNFLKLLTQLKNSCLYKKAFYNIHFIKWL